MFLQSFFFKYKNIKAKQAERVQAIKHDGMRSQPAEFEGNPTYKGKKSLIVTPFIFYIRNFIFL